MKYRQYYVYILASRAYGTLYIGVTRDLLKRVWEHKQSLVEGFTKKYKVYRLVYYEIYDEARAAIVRERRMKKWKRDWKINLIEKVNSEWEDLYPQLLKNP